MPRKKLLLSGYSSMWLFVMFDLPVKTRKDRKIYGLFRKTLLEDGFTMIQFSIYVRYCTCEEIAEKHRNIVRKAVPSRGRVRILHLTDRQYGKMESYSGVIEIPSEKTPRQLMLF